MQSSCACGNPIGHEYDELGCIECGQLCCPDCAVFLESVTYCARCARALVQAPIVPPGGPPATT